MKLRAGVLALLLAAVCCRGRAHAAEGEVTLAVAAVDAQAAPVAALVEVGLSQQGVRLVERTEIDRILQEQELNAAGLADRQALVKVGRLLRADAFLLLSVEDPPKKLGEKQVPGLLRMRLTETVHGVRLQDWYATWVPEEAEEAATQVVQEASGPLAKLSLPSGELIPVGIVDIHRALLGEEHEWLCRALKAMVSARLSKEPQIVVLEREDLALLQEEKGLTAGAQDDFWTSGVLVEGTLERAGKDNMELRLQIRPAGGEARDLPAIAVDANAPGPAGEQAAVALLGELTKGPLTGTLDPEQEAAEFWQQGVMLSSHRRFQAAIPLLETAFALSPEDVQYGAAVLNAATQPVSPGQYLYTDLQKAELAARLTALAQRRRAGDSWGDADDTLVRMLGFYMTDRTSTSDERVTEINRTTRRAVRELTQAVSEGGKAPPGRLSARDLHSAAVVLMGASTVDEAVQAVREWVGRKIMPPALGGTIESFRERCDVAMGFVDGMSRLLAGDLAGDRANHLYFNDYKLPTALFFYFQQLAASEDPLVRFCGWLLCGSRVRAPMGYRMPPWQPPADQSAYLDRASEVFQKDLQGRPDMSPAAAGLARGMLEGKVSAAQPGDGSVAFLERVLSPLAERGDVDGLMPWLAHEGQGGGTRVNQFYPGLQVTPQASARYCVLMDRIAAVLEPEAARDDVANVLSWLWYNSDGVKDALRQYLKRGGTGGSDVVRLLPELGRPPDRRVRVEMLLRQSDWFRPWQFRPDVDVIDLCVLQGQMLWIAFNDHASDRGVGLASIDLAARRLQSLWQTTVPERPNGFLNLMGVVVRPDKSYVAVRDVGLVEFPGSDSPGRGFVAQPHVLGEKDGLPPGWVTGVAPAGDKLWIVHTGEGGSGVGLFDPRTGDWQSLVLSTRRAESQVGEGRSYSPDKLLSVPDGLLFWGRAARKVGFYLLRTGSGWPECLGQTYAEGIRRLVDAPGGPLLFTTTSVTRLATDEKEIQILLVSGPYKSLLGKQIEGQAFRTVLKPFVRGRAESNPELLPAALGCLDALDAAIHRDELWAPYGETQIIILRRGTTMKDAEFIPNDILDGKRVRHFLSTPYGLVAVGEGGVGLVEGAQ